MGLKAPPKPLTKANPPVTSKAPVPQPAPSQSDDPEDQIPGAEVPTTDTGEPAPTQYSAYGDGLPDAPTDQDVKLTSLRWLFVAPPGFGKTEFFSLFPNSLMLACEEGHKFVTGHKIIIDKWAGPGSAEDTDGNLHMSFQEAVKRIEASARFEFIIVDTLDALVKMCIDHHIGKANQAHLSDLGEYGKGYDLGQNDPIRRELSRIFKSGRGMGLITHQQIETKSFSKGPKSKKETTLPNGIYKLIYPQMDLIIHGEFGAQREGNNYRDRIIKSEGSEDILAKNRGGVLPPAWLSPQDMTERAAQIREFFEGSAEERTASIQKAFTDFGEIYDVE